ncbi:MAG TPA: PDZ domain-containing protein, partial [Thermoanaerobaculia bacterium]
LALAQPLSAQIGDEVRPRERHDSLAQHRRELDMHRAEMERHRAEMERHAAEMREALARAYGDSAGAVRVYRDGAMDSARFLYRTRLQTSCARLGLAFDGDDTIVVREVLENSGAEAAGVREGDVIVSVDGERANGRVMAELAGQLEAGDRVRILVLRDGSERTLDVTAREDMCPYRTMLSHEPLRVMCLSRDSSGSVDDDCEHEFVYELQRGLEELRHTMPLRMYREDGDSGTFLFRFDGPDGFSDSIFIDLDSVRMMAEGMTFQLDSLREMMPFTVEMADSLRMLMPKLDMELRMNEEALHAHGLMLRSLELGARALAGASITELNDDLAGYFDADHGVLVTDVEDGTPAARAGLRGGDVIIEVNGNEVHQLGDVHQHAARAEGPIELTVVRGGERRTIRLAE